VLDGAAGRWWLCSRPPAPRTTSWPSSWSSGSPARGHRRRRKAEVKRPWRRKMHSHSQLAALSAAAESNVNVNTKEITKDNILG
jgi:hypothetical protein